MLSWESIAGAVEYYIEATLDDMEVWSCVYQGPNTSSPFNRPTGTYRVKGKTKDTTHWGPNSKPKIIDVP